MAAIDWVKLEWVEQEAHALRSVFPSLSKNYVPGEGDNARAFIIGEAPGATEDITRRPFTGKCAVLRDLMAIAGYKAERNGTVPEDGWQPNCWLTNVVKFRPPGNRNPSNAEIKAFRRLLQDEWVAVGSPSVIIPVGGIALSAVFGRAMSILRSAGRCHTMLSAYTGKPLYIWPMVHPAFGLRAGEQMQELIEQDWEKLARWRNAKNP